MSISSAICPGERALFNHDEAHHYLRVVFGVEWIDDYPGFEEFYFRDGSIRPTNVHCKDTLEATIRARLENYCGEGRVFRVFYLSFSGFELTENQAAELGWKVVEDAVV